VDDDALNRFVMLRALERLGHHPTAVAGGRDALLLLRAIRFDLVLMDLEMPDLDGCATVGMLREMEREHGGRVPVIALTANTTPGLRQRCAEVGMDAHITKPVDPTQLAEFIARWGTVPSPPDR
jgi:CheY-like chemotaxis protein